jgi:hypothetical protein
VVWGKRVVLQGRPPASPPAAAVDILAAAPLVSATTLGQALGMAIKNATRLLEGFVVLGIANEVTHRSKRRLFGLKHLAPLRETAAPPRRPLPGRRPGRPSGAPFPASDGNQGPAPTASVRPPSPPLPPLERIEYEFGELDRWLDLADQAIRRTQRVLDETVQVASVPRGGSSAPRP